MSRDLFVRTELLIGKESIEKLSRSKVVVFGVGGVGSFVVEALVRAGVGKLVLVDNDTVAESNINRQIIATTKTIDRPKVEIAKERVLEINPECQVTIFQTFVNEGNISDIVTEDVDYVVDAIDTVSSKIALVIYCEKHNIKIISSMGTGNKLDPTQFKISDIYKTKVCPLAKVMRCELRKRGVDKLKVLYSEEEPRTPMITEETKAAEAAGKKDDGVMRVTKRQTPGSISFVPPVAGMIIGGEVIKDIINIR